VCIPAKGIYILCRCGTKSTKVNIPEILKELNSKESYRKLKTFEEIKKTDMIKQNEEFIPVDYRLIGAHWTKHLIQVYRK